MRGFRRRYSQPTPKPSEDDLRTRFVGTCPVCQKRHKLTAKGDEKYELVHHGYQRPGHGSIVGDCFGVKYEPYELSTKGCEDYKAYAKRIEENLTGHLANLESGKIRTLSISKTVRVSFGQSKIESITVSADSEDAKERAEFARELESLIYRTKGEIKGWQFEQERMARLIADWKLQAIITWQEHLEQVKRERFEAGAARRAELAAKRAVREEKARILAEKKTRWEQEKTDLMAKYKGLFEKLATGVESLKDRQQCARSHWADMYKAKHKKGYLNFWERDLGCDEALVTLGLAKIDNTSGRPWTYYADHYGYLR